MATVERLPATLNLRLKPGNQSINFDASPADLTGTWVVKIRKSLGNDTALLTPTMDTTDAADGVVVLPFTEEQLAGLIPEGASQFVGVWEAQKDSVPWFAGSIRVDQKASR